MSSCGVCSNELIKIGGYYSDNELIDCESEVDLQSIIVLDNNFGNINLSSFYDSNIDCFQNLYLYDNYYLSSLDNSFCSRNKAWLQFPIVQRYFTDFDIRQSYELVYYSGRPLQYFSHYSLINEWINDKYCFVFYDFRYNNIRDIGNFGIWNDDQYHADKFIDYNYRIYDTVGWFVPLGLCGSILDGSSLWSYTNVFNTAALDVDINNYFDDIEHISFSDLCRFLDKFGKKFIIRLPYGTVTLLEVGEPCICDNLKRLNMILKGF